MSRLRSNPPVRTPCKCIAGSVPSTNWNFQSGARTVFNILSIARGSISRSRIGCLARRSPTSSSAMFLMRKARRTIFTTWRHGPFWIRYSRATTERSSHMARLHRARPTPCKELIRTTNSFYVAILTYRCRPTKRKAAQLYAPVVSDAKRR